MSFKLAKSLFPNQLVPTTKKSFLQSIIEITLAFHKYFASKLATAECRLKNTCIALAYIILVYAFVATSSKMWIIIYLASQILPTKINFTKCIDKVKYQVYNTDRLAQLLSARYRCGRSGVRFPGQSNRLSVANGSPLLRRFFGAV